MMRIRKGFAVAFIAIAVVMAYLGFTPISLPNDKFLHFIFFFLLTTVFYWIVDTSRRRLINVTTIVCIVIGGIGSEFLQTLVPTRTFDPYDIVANVAGASLSLLGSSWYHKRMLDRKRAQKYSSVPSSSESGDLESGYAASPEATVESVQLEDLSSSSTEPTK
ncbi:uncharacterized protein V1516DRAFT_681544 [Lipomyces oligophaga]|uniref:uncharacterized protein n=1 Tax=Lipomyces oligophaga TaxID=45792 RepID=UPI0034CF2002